MGINLKPLLEIAEDPVFILDMNDTLLGESIGEGQYRSVYTCKLNPKLVIKVQKDPGQSNNIVEFDTWQQLQWVNPRIRDWFMPCNWCSQNGRFLVQPKGKDIPIETGRRKIKVPEFLTDVKRENFKLYKGKMVIVDYDFTIFKLFDLHHNFKMREITQDEWNNKI